MTFTENGSDTALAPEALVSDPDSPDFNNGSLSAVITSGATSGDVLRLVGRSGFGVDGRTLYYNELAVGTIFFGDFESPLFVLFNANMTPAIAQALVRSISFFTTSNDATPRTVEFTLDDGDEGATTATAEVAIAGDPTVARDDALATGENAVLIGDLFADNGNGADVDPNGTLRVTAVNGVPARVGQTFELQSGALLRVNEDGTFSYDPNGRFEALVPFGSGVPGDRATDSFSYTVDGESSATVTITILGEADAVNTFNGTSGDDSITGTPFRDIFLLQDGGHDHVTALAGNDTFYFGASFKVETDRVPGDRVAGGEGSDSIILKGQYDLILGFAEFDFSIIQGIESFSLAPGNYTGFGGTDTGLTRYNITTVDENVEAGQTLKFNAFHLRVGENFTLNGSDESDGRFIVLAGLGVDNLTGGGGNDVFVFGHGGRFGSSDVVNGGGGYDVVYLRGDYSIDFTSAGAGTIGGVESIFLASTTDAQYTAGGDGEFDYSIVWDDAMLATGLVVTVNGSTLGSSETMVFNGSDEEGGRFRLFGGAAADTLTGGGGGDFLYGGFGADALRGNGGSDHFRYYNVAESAPGAGNFDTILDFTHNVDLIDLNFIDANSKLGGDQAFEFIGSAEFAMGGASAGQLRAVQTDLVTNTWRIEGDVDGDRTADLVIIVQVDPLQPLTASDFIL